MFLFIWFEAWWTNRPSPQGCLGGAPRGAFIYEYIGEVYDVEEFAFRREVRRAIHAIFSGCLSSSY